MRERRKVAHSTNVNGGGDRRWRKGTRAEDSDGTGIVTGGCGDSIVGSQLAVWPRYRKHQ